MGRFVHSFSLCTMGVLGVAASTSREYLRGSAVAGLSHAAKAKSAPRRVYWYTSFYFRPSLLESFLVLFRLVLFCFGLFMTGRGILQLLTEFAASPVITRCPKSFPHTLIIPLK